jgi:hypothetical protein
MDEPLRKPETGQRRDDGSCFHEVRTRTDDMGYGEAAISHPAQYGERLDVPSLP